MNFNSIFSRSTGQSVMGFHRQGRASVLGALSLISVFCFGMSASAISPDSRLTIRKQSITSSGGSFNITATCQSDEVRLGGGYKYAEQKLDGSIVENVSVEGNFPSGSRGWTVKGNHYNPDDEERFISAEAYCLKGSTAQAVTVSSPLVRSEMRPSAQFFSAQSEVSCPANTVATSGGFRTTSTKEHSGAYNAWISSFTPTKNASGQAKGWRAVLDAITWQEPPARPTLQTFAVCVTSGSGPDSIEGTSVVAKNIPSRTAFGYSILGAANVQCPYGEVALGGGYKFGDAQAEGGAADLFVPHQVFQSRTLQLRRVIESRPGTKPPARGKPRPRLPVSKGASTKSPSTSQKMTMVTRVGKASTNTNARTNTVVKAKRGKKPDTMAPAPGPASSTPTPFEHGLEQAEANAPTEMANPNHNPVVNFGGWSVGGVFGSQTQSQKLAGYAACVKLPSVSLTVEITAPEDNAAIAADLSLGGNNIRTGPIQLTAVARDANQNTAQGITYSWLVNGVVVGGGAQPSLQTTLPAKSCGVDNVEIRVNAHDAQGHHATDKIRVRVGQIC